MKYEDIMDLTTLRRALEMSWNRDTAYHKDRDRWDKNNPAAGQCAITSLIVNDYFGGEIVKGMSDGGIEHYWNIIDSKIVDLTLSQYRHKVEFVDKEIVGRDFLLESGDVNERYSLLKHRIASK